MRIIPPQTPLIEELSNNPDNHRYSLFGRTFFMSGEPFEKVVKKDFLKCP